MQNIWHTQPVCKTSIFPYRSLRVRRLSSFWIFPSPLAVTEKRLCEWTGCTFECGDRPEPSPTYHRSADSGNFLVISSTVAYTIGLTWGGITAPWGSITVLVPLVLGLVGLGVFVAYEATFAKHPLARASLCFDPNFISPYPCQVPFSLMTNMTSISG